MHSEDSFILPLSCRRKIDVALHWRKQTCWVSTSILGEALFLLERLGGELFDIEDREEDVPCGWRINERVAGSLLGVCKEH